MPALYCNAAKTPLSGFPGFLPDHLKEQHMTNFSFHTPAPVAVSEKVSQILSAAATLLSGLLALVTIAPV